MDELSVFKKLEGIEIKGDERPCNLLHTAYQYAYQKENLHSQLLRECLICNKNDDWCVFKGFLQKVCGVVDVFKHEHLLSLKITTERNINGRRIDLFIEWKNAAGQKYAVIIENKINGAADQPNQLNDYYDGIKSEGYKVEAVIYLCFAKHKPYYPITFDKSIFQIIDIQNLIEWIKGCTETNLPKDSISDCDEDGRILGISRATARCFTTYYQYWEFLECLQFNNLIQMKALEIINQCSVEEINKLENLASIAVSPEWSAARFTSLSENLRSTFGEKLKIKCKRYSDGRCYAEFFFLPYNKWIELWLNEENIVLWIVSDTESDSVNVLGQQYKWFENDNYHYYTTDLSFSYPVDNQELIDKITPMLEEMAKYKNPTC